MHRPVLRRHSAFTLSVVGFCRSVAAPSRKPETGSAAHLQSSHRMEFGMIVRPDGGVGSAPQSSSPRARAVTINDVAGLAGVSRAAVSKVIRNAYGVSPAMREKVGRAIVALGYRPNSAARAMRGKSFVIGFEIPGLSNDFLITILKAAHEALAASEYQLIVAPADADDYLGARAIESLVDHQVDGLVAVSTAISVEWLQNIARRIPLVMIGRHDQSVNYDTVVGDDSAGAALVMEHLLSQGHSRIAHLTRGLAITAPPSRSPHAVRLEGYVEAMTAAGLTENISVVRSGSSQLDSQVGITPLLASPERPTAVFAGNDEMALGVMHAAKQLGMTFADLAIVGYDDIDIASYPGISLSSVNQSGSEMGEVAIRLLLERFEGRTDRREVEMAPVLKVRESSSSAKR